MSLMPLIVDVHSHLYPRVYLDRMKRRGRSEIPRVEGAQGEERFIIFPDEAKEPGGGRLLGPEFWDIQAKLTFMGEFGIDRSIVSLGNPWLNPFEPEESARLARELNTGFARLQQDTKGRIAALGVLPNANIEAAICEIEWIADQPGLRGIVTGTKIVGFSLDSPELDPLWTAIADHQLVLFVHPHYAAAISDLGGFGHGLPVALGFPFETTIALTRLTLAGALERHPDLRILAAHGGGTLPFLAGRVDAGWRSDPQARTRLRSHPSDSLRHLYLDAVVYHERALRTAIDLVGADHVAFGTDHPFSVADPEANLSAIKALSEPAVQEQILGGAAGQLFRMK